MVVLVLAIVVVVVVMPIAAVLVLATVVVVVFMPIATVVVIPLSSFLTVLLFVDRTALNQRTMSVHRRHGD